MNYAIILAAGKGSRMNTSMAKGRVKLVDMPMVEYVYNSVKNDKIDEVICVVGYRASDIIEILSGGVRYVAQDVLDGTGGAVRCALPYIDDEGFTIITMCDLPLIDNEIYNNLVEKHNKGNNDITMLTMIVDNPKGYGRVLGGKIIEECMLDGEDSNEVFSGVMCVNNSFLKKNIDLIKNNNIKNEYFITDLLRFTSKVGKMLVDKDKGMGVNDMLSLYNASNYIINENIKKHLSLGVNIIGRPIIGTKVYIASGTTILDNCFITGNTSIGRDSIIGPYSVIDNSSIGANNKIVASQIYDSLVLDNCNIGPYAHIRNYSTISGHNRIGNFVEVKNSAIGESTKASHLSYIGDTICGKNVNFGCGSITVNFDGVNKHKTVIGDNSFIGCNSNLIAPIEISEDAYIAAGSTIYKNVNKGDLAIARSYQVNKPDYSRKKND